MATLFNTSGERCYYTYGNELRDNAGNTVGHMFGNEFRDNACNTLFRIGQ